MCQLVEHASAALDLGEANEIASLRKLLDTLNDEIINKLEALNNLRESSDYDLHQRCHRQSGLLDEVGDDLTKAIFAEIAVSEAAYKAIVATLPATVAILPQRTPQGEYLLAFDLRTMARLTESPT